MATTYEDAVPNRCPHCGCWHDGVCPRVKAIDYYPDGTLKRVEYKDEAAPVPTSTVETVDLSGVPFKVVRKG